MSAIINPGALQLPLQVPTPTPAQAPSGAKSAIINPGALNVSAPTQPPVPVPDNGGFLKSLLDIPGKIGNDVFVQPAIGFAKKAASEALNVGKMGGQALDAGAQAVGLKPLPSSPDTFTGVQNALQPTDVFQKAGSVALDALEFMAPAGEIAKGAKAIDTVLAGTDFLSGAGRAVAKAGLEAGASAPITAAQTGDVKQGEETGLLTGALAGSTGILGEAARASGIPEAMYQKIFKNTASDALAELRSTVNDNLKATDPEKYQKLLDAGIIQEKAGQPVVNETVAKKALDSGLKGSIENMAKTVIKNNYDNELAARATAANVKEPLKLEPNYKKTLDLISQSYQEAGLGRVSQKAAALSAKIGENGQISASDALDVRRFLDGMRSRASFDTSTPLPLKQENLKELTDALRGKINNLPGMGGIMKSYSFNIDAADDLAKEAARRGNNQIISLLDAGLFGGGILSHDAPTGLAIGIGRRVLNSPTALTNIAQGLNKSVPTLGGILGRAYASRGASSFLNPGNQQSTEIE